MSNWPPYWNDFPDISERSATSFTDLVASDGVLLQICRIAGPAKDCIVVVPPIMFSVLRWLPTMVKLSRLMPVLAWDPRGWSSSPCDEVDHTVERYIRDVEEVADANGLDAIHMVALCGGTDLALEIIGRGSLKLASAAFVTPRLPVPVECVSSDNAAVTRELFRMCYLLANADGKVAEMVYRRLRRMMKLDEVAQDPALMAWQRLTDLIWGTCSRARQYTRAIRDFHDERNQERKCSVFEELCRMVPTHLLCYQDDEVVGFPRDLAARPPGHLSIDAPSTGGHEGSMNSELIYSSLAGFYNVRFGIPLPPSESPASLQGATC